MKPSPGVLLAHQNNMGHPNPLTLTILHATRPAPSFFKAILVLNKIIYQKIKIRF
jgi:hypothetical protein